MLKVCLQMLEDVQTEKGLNAIDDRLVGLLFFGNLLDFFSIKNEELSDARRNHKIKVIGPVITFQV